MDKRTVYIYALIDPRTDEVRYVGKTVDPTHRLYHHARTDKNATAAWSAEMAAEGLEPEMVTIDETDGDDWEALEMEWIVHFCISGARLLNRQFRDMPLSSGLLRRGTIYLAKSALSGYESWRILTGPTANTPEDATRPWLTDDEMRAILMGRKSNNLQEKTHG